MSKVSERAMNFIRYYLENGVLGLVGWGRDDFRSAIEECDDIATCEDNIDILMNAVDEGYLEGVMIQAGWNYIYDLRDKILMHGIDGKHFVSKRQCWDVEFVTSDGTPDITELCTDYHAPEHTQLIELGKLINSLRDEMDIVEVTNITKTHTEMA